jgi:hypothetical protein
MKLSAQVSSFLSRVYRVFFLSLGLVLLFLFASPVATHAQTRQLPSYAQPNVETDVEQNQHTLVQSVTIEMMAALICQLAGVDVINPQQGCLGINPATKKLGYVNQNNTQQIGGLISMGTQMVTAMYTPPASGIGHMQYVASNFGITKKALAQIRPGPVCDLESPNGDCIPNVTGFDALAPGQRLWITARNISFIFFVLVFVLIGIGIMLRVKLDAKTVMTIQNQLPKIVVALVLISFSYAIVGFLVDFMWTSTYMGINLLTDGYNPEGTLCEQPTDLGDSLKGKAYNNILNYPLAFTSDIFNGSLNCADGKDFKSGISGLAWQTGKALGTVLSDVITEVISPADDGCGITHLDDCASHAIAWFVGWIASVIGLLIALIAIVIALFRLWFSLLKAYAYIIIYTITAPFWIMLGLMPNSSMGFSRWIRTVIANLTVFPAAVVMIIMARIVLDLYGRGTDGSAAAGSFVTPLIGNPSLNAFGPLLALGILLITPELLNTIRDSLKTPSSKLGGVAAAGFMAGYGPGTALPRNILNRQWAIGGHGVDAGRARAMIAGTGNPNWFQRRARGLGITRGFKATEFHPVQPGAIKESGGHSG